jgi:hypothetical protein
MLPPLVVLSTLFHLEALYTQGIVSGKVDFGDRRDKLF